MHYEDSYKHVDFLGCVFEHKLKDYQTFQQLTSTVLSTALKYRVK